MATNVVRRSLMTIMTCIKVEGQRSTEVKCDNLCYKATTFDQMYRYKNDNDLYEGHPKIIKGQIVNHAVWLSNFVRSTNESTAAWD